MKKTKKYLILLVIILAAGIVISLTYTFAKYVKDIVWEYHLKSKGFYFSSMELDINQKENIKNSWDGSAVFFTLNNSQNEELITDYDINYEASCEVTGEMASQATCHLNGTESSEDTGILASYQGCINNKQDGIEVSGYTKSDCELGGYTWKNQMAIKELYFEIVPTEPDLELNMVTVSIEVKSTSPYKKTLKGEFILYKKHNDDQNIQINYQNFDNYGKLALTNNQNKLRCASLKWDTDKVLIDEELSSYKTYELDQDGYIKSIKIDLNSNSSRELTFFKKISEELTTEDFIFEECLIEND